MGFRSNPSQGEGSVWCGRTKDKLALAQGFFRLVLIPGKESLK
jgi:hypothetical protein